MRNPQFILALHTNGNRSDAFTIVKIEGQKVTISMLNGAPGTSQRHPAGSFIQRTDRVFGGIEQLNLPIIVSNNAPCRDVAVVVAHEVLHAAPYNLLDVIDQANLMYYSTALGSTPAKPLRFKERIGARIRPGATEPDLENQWEKITR